MIICCNKGIDSLSNNYYYLVDFDSIEELQEYIHDKLPIMGREIELGLNGKRTYLDEDISREMLIYLNKYTHIYETQLTYLTDEQYELLEKQCETCKFYKYVGLGHYKCQYVFNPNEDYYCKCYLEKSDWFYRITKLFKKN